MNLFELRKIQDKTEVLKISRHSVYSAFHRQTYHILFDITCDVLRQFFHFRKYRSQFRLFYEILTEQSVQK